MGIIAAGQITVVDLSDAPVLNAFITASRPTTQTYSKDSRNYNPSYASTPQVLTLNVTKSGSTTSIIDSISGLHWFVVDGSVKTEITSKVNTSNEYISGNNNENLTTKLNIDTNKGYRRYEATGVWRDPSTDLDVQFSASIDLLLTQNGATGPQGPQGDDGPQGPQGDKGETGNGIANTVVTYGLSMNDTTEPATWSSERPALVKGMYLWTRTVIIYTNGESTTSYQISYIPKDGDATGEIDKTKQELLEKLETVRDDSLAAVEEAKQQLVTVRDESLAAAEEAKQQVTTVANDLSKAKTDFQNAVNTVDTKATNVQNDLSKAKQDLASQAQQLQEQANAQSELTNRVSSVEETANGTRTSVSELSKTVAQNGKNITSVTARTKVVEDDLAGTKTTLSQVKMTADSTSQKTATLETGLDGLSTKFENLKIGGANLLMYSADPSKAPSGYYDFTNAQKTSETYNGSVVYKTQRIWSGIRVNLGNLVDRGLLKVGDVLTYSVAMRAEQTTPIQARLFIRYTNQSGADSPTNKIETVNLTTDWQYVSVTFTVTAKMLAANTKVTYLGWALTSSAEAGKYVYYACNKIERGNVATDYSSNDADLEQKVAEYKQNADQNYASLQTTVQNLDGTVQHNKTVAEQTAEGFKTRIESLETYKSGESTRANQYFELAKAETARQLSVERTAIAKDYVAKSTYTSDVTGIRNELSATTTTANTIKTNLANYQATNDRAVANLQSSMQTANGNISSLKTKVEAVPGQITSAVSAVESKIPTSVNTVNLIKDTDKPFTMGYGITNTTWDNDKKWAYLDLTAPNVSTANASEILPQGQFYNFKPTKGMTYTQSILIDTDAAFNPNGTPQNTWFTSQGHNQKRGYFEKLSDTTYRFWSTCTWELEDIALRAFDWYGLHTVLDFRNSGTYLAFYKPKLTTGNLPSDWSLSPEDYDDVITQVKSEIKQTADGITLLATKTELNAAKNELQSGITAATNKANNAQYTANNNAQTITTHTTQISALNTGLQAKVSQSDFNVLSGRVTTAENNITAKANELSSKITTVEGKIPTSVGGRNLWIQSKVTGDFVEETLPDNHVTGQKKCYRITNYKRLEFNIEPDFSSRLYRKVTFSAWVKYENVVQGENSWNKFNCFKHSLYYKNSTTGATTNSNPLTLEGFTGTSDWKRITCTYDYSSNKSYDQLKTTIYFNLEGVRSGTAWVTGVKVEIGSIPSDYSPAPEDYDSDLASVEGKIPTSVGTVNLVKGTGSAFVMGYGITNTTWNETKKQSILDFSAPGVRRDITSEILPQGNKFNDFKPIKGTTYTQSIMIDTDATFNPNGQMEFTWFANGQHNSQKSYIKKVGAYSYQVWSTYTWNLENTALRAFDLSNLHNVLLFRTSGSYLAFYKPKLTAGNLPSDWSPSPDDYDDALTRVSSEIKQTADGITLLATKTELNSAKNELQSGINTATNKANNAQTTANNNAQTISTHTTQISALNTGLSAKVSQSDFNTLSGRVTTAENNITAKANELSSKITSVEGKIPTSSGGRNLAQGTSKDWSTPFTSFYGGQNTCPSLYKVLTDGLIVGDTFKTRIVLKYTNIVPASGKKAEIWLQGAGNVTDWNSGTYPSGGGGRRSISGSGEIVFELTDKINSDHLRNKYWSTSFRTDWIASGSLQWKLAKAERGMFFTDWQPAPEDAINQISSLSSEFKQTTDSIKASVQSLDNNTVKNSSLTINADGIVMKAGKSTTDVANAIGSYFAVNQNAINLFSDKIKVKGNMIVSGSISSDKIAASGITANVIKGGTLQSTNGSTNFELNTGKLFYNNNNTGVFRVQSGASTMGLKFSNTPITVNGTSRILSRAILGGDRNENTLDDGKWDKGGFSGLVIETIKGAIPAVNEHADSLRAISDTIYFTHTYSADEPTGVSAHGWKMETYAPDSSISGNIVLKPYGLNYRQSDIIVGDIRLDNGDGSGYWMRATINTLKACFGHILNGGTSSQALNAIRSELNKISGI